MERKNIRLQPKAFVAAIVALFTVASLAGCINNPTAEREAVIEDYIELEEELTSYYPAGSISFSDKGSFFEIKRVADFGSSADLSYIEAVEQDQLKVDMLAFQIGCPVLTCDYDRDGYLVALQIGYPDAATRKSGGNPEGSLKERMDELTAAADNFASSNRSRILEEHSAIILSVKSDGDYCFTDVSYEIAPDGIWFNLIQPPNRGYRAYMTDEEFANAVDTWTDHAESATLSLRDSVGYRIYTSDGELDLETSSPMIDYYMNPRINQDE